MSQIHIVVGGQFGSEAKGHFAAQLAMKLYRVDPLRTPMMIRTGGPNAGHTVWAEGTEYKLRQIPAACAKIRGSIAAIAAGSEIDPDVLELEMKQFPDHRIMVDHQATVIENHHIERESTERHFISPSFTPATLVEQIGSTGKGVGAARSDRIMRQAAVARDFYGESNGFPLYDVAKEATIHLLSGAPVIIEASQGYGLGLHAGYYPKCTSRDVRAIDALGEVGLSPWQPGVTEVIVWIVMRPYPIRVAGNSGPLKGETTWEELGLPKEFTTVTQKVRRVGSWDPDLAREAIRANGGPAPNVRPVLMMADQFVPELAGLEDFPNPLADEAWHKLNDLGNGLPGQSRFWAMGTGPDSLIWCYDF